MIPSWRARLVWQRNAEVYLRTWFLNLLPPLLEPLLYIAAFGVGMGALVRTIPVGGLDVPYRLYVAPGMIAVAIMQQAYFEGTFGSFIRMYYQKTFDAIVATPCSLEDVVAGEIAWAATKAVGAAALMLAALWPFGLVSMPSSLWILPLAALAGWFFASGGFCIAALVPQIDAFNLPMFLLIMPMFALSETFFPLPASGWMRTLGSLLPLTQVSRMARAAALGLSLPASSLPALAALAAGSILFSWLGLRLMRRRLIP